LGFGSLSESEEFSRSSVVATVMSNMALEEHLALEGIPVFRCPVGDKYVVETMRYQRSALGGEQSGHNHFG
jgi:phosphoglucosamine mutase